MRAATAVGPAVMLPQAATERRRHGKRWNCFAKRAEIPHRRGSQGRSEHEFPHGRRITGGHPLPGEPREYQADGHRIGAGARALVCSRTRPTCSWDRGAKLQSATGVDEGSAVLIPDI
jgi:hypothetical protein